MAALISLDNMAYNFFLTTESGSFMAHDINAYIKVWVIYGTRRTQSGTRFQSNIVRKFEKLFKR